jgi:hypothetical protein
VSNLRQVATEKPVFVRKRLRGNSVSFTVVQSVRTPRGPRQKIVAGWSTPVDAGAYFWCPSIAGALEAARGRAARYQQRAEYWSAALQVSTHPRVVYIPTIGRTMHISRDVASRELANLERHAAREIAMCEALSFALDELGNWTWDGQL